ncbi:hypothetical protein VB773_00845 [Haloarculaceae archaeon H-GB2-1]|nr:hypothetical protein [Haloarculaceae archaeon H-GB11]MEA5406266.1 hypothetical protein [Haloarculaceae archaeon H-GB2-1]
MGEHGRELVERADDGRENRPVDRQRGVRAEQFRMGDPQRGSTGSARSIANTNPNAVRTTKKPSARAK